MVLPHGQGDLYHKYRPRRFDEIVGHTQVVTSMRKAIAAAQPSRAYLLIGDSGTGKTTSARIMALSLNCQDRDKSGEPCLKCKSCKAILSSACSDVVEVNCADHRGIDAIRSLCSTMAHMPMQLSNKIYILDECHQLTKDAQSSLLKELEEAPKHVFIILCTTDPEKVLRTVKTRCQQFKFNSLRREELLSLMKMIAVFETYDFSELVYTMVADASGGSPRQALVLLQQVAQLGSTDPTEIGVLLETEEAAGKGAIALCFELGSGKTSWSKLMAAYDKCREDGPPTIGMIIAGYFRNQLIKARSPDTAARLAAVLGYFVQPLSPGKLGENELILNLYRAYTALYITRTDR